MGTRRVWSTDRIVVSAMTRETFSNVISSATCSVLPYVLTFPDDVTSLHEWSISTTRYHVTVLTRWRCAEVSNFELRHDAGGILKYQSQNTPVDCLLLAFYWTSVRLISFVFVQVINNCVWIKSYNFRESLEMSMAQDNETVTSHTVSVMTDYVVAATIARASVVPILSWHSNG